jgi:hypothetical protein
MSGPRGQERWRRHVLWDLLKDRLLQLCPVAAPLGFDAACPPPLPRLVHTTRTHAGAGRRLASRSRRWARERRHAGGAAGFELRDADT